MSMENLIFCLFECVKLFPKRSLDFCNTNDWSSIRSPPPKKKLCFVTILPNAYVRIRSKKNREKLYKTWWDFNFDFKQWQRSKLVTITWLEKILYGESTISIVLLDRALENSLHLPCTNLNHFTISTNAETKLRNMNKQERSSTYIMYCYSVYSIRYFNFYSSWSISIFSRKRNVDTVGKMTTLVMGYRVHNHNYRVVKQFRTWENKKLKNNKTLSTILSFIRILYLKQQSNICRSF